MPTVPWAFSSDHARVETFRHRDRDFGYDAHDDTWGTITVMAGLPGSGKDRWIARNAADLPAVSLHALRDTMPRSTPSERASRGHELAKEFLRTQTPFVWNSTNLVRDLRAGLFELCYRYHAKVRVVYVEVPVGEQAAQNGDREWTEVVPAAAMRRFLDKWDIPDASEAHTLDFILSNN